jgi:hypothetical protein
VESAEFPFRMITPSGDSSIEYFRAAERHVSSATKQATSAWRTMAKALFVQLAHGRSVGSSQQKHGTTSRVVYREILRARNPPESVAFVLARANWHICMARLFLRALRRDVLFRRAAEAVCAQRHAAVVTRKAFHGWLVETRREGRRRRRLLLLCVEHWCRYVALRTGMRRIAEGFHHHLRQRLAFRRNCQARCLRFLFAFWRLRCRSLRNSSANSPFARFQQGRNAEGERHKVSVARTAASLDPGHPEEQGPLHAVFAFWRTRTERRLWAFLASRTWRRRNLERCLRCWRKKSMASQKESPKEATLTASSTSHVSCTVVHIRESTVERTAVNNDDFRLQCAARVSQAVMLSGAFLRWRHRANARRASAFYRLQTLRTSVALWRSNLHGRLVDRIRASRVFHWWHQAYRQQRDLRAAEGAAREKLKAAVFSRWRTCAASARHQRRSPIRQCLAIWADKTAVRRCRAALVFLKLRRHFVAWREVSICAVTRRTDRLVAAAIRHEVLLGGCFRWWRRRAEESTRLAMMTAVLDTIRMERLRRMCFSRWKWLHLRAAAIDPRSHASNEEVSLPGV